MEKELSFKLEKVARIGKNLATSLLTCHNKVVPYLECCLNGYVCNFLLDTGANISLIHDKLVGNAKTSHDNVECTNGTILHISGKVWQSFKISNKTFNHQFLCSKDLKYDGILGYDFVKSVRATIDTNKSTFNIDRWSVPLIAANKGCRTNYNNGILLEETHLVKFLEKYSDVFADDDYSLGSTSVISHKINTKCDPIRQPSRRIPVALGEVVKENIDKMLEMGIISHSDSPWSSPIVMVKKKDGSHRFCIDYRKLNANVEIDPYPLPRIDDTLRSLDGSSVFSTLDLKSGYWQIEVSPSDRKKTAFITPFGLYEFNVMPFGLNNAPATFQRAMATILKGCVGRNCFIYLDDIIVFSDSKQQHLEDLAEILEKLKTNGLKLHRKKCEFFQSSVNFLGHVISAEGIRVDNNKIKAILKYPTPTNEKELRRFLGLANYYRTFIKDFSKISEPLYKLTSKNTKFTWNNDCQKSFASILRKLSSTPILAYPDYSKPFCLTTDASNVAVGAILSQNIPGTGGVVAYFSRTLTKAEKNYSTFDKEALAIVSAIKEFRHHLYGRHFDVYTDHNPLCYLNSLKDSHGRIARWLTFLQDFDFSIHYKRGSTNTNADSLSRIQSKINSLEAKTTMLDELKNNTKGDTFLESYKQKILKNGGLYKTKRGNFSILGNGLICREYVLNGEKHHQICVPEKLRNACLSEMHDQMFHSGCFKTFDNLRTRYYWPGYHIHTNKYVAECTVCQKYRSSPLAKPPLEHFKPSRPFDVIQCDVVGPLETTARGNKYILVITDIFSKWVEAFPLPAVTSRDFVDILVKHIVSRFGIPRQIHTDQGTNFTSRIVEDFCRSMNIAKTRTTSYHPEGNGVVERFNKTMKEMLKKCFNTEENWDLYLPYLLLVYRNTTHETTRCSPSEILFGRRLPMPCDHFEELHSPIYSDASQYMIKDQKQVKKFWVSSKKNMEKSFDKMERFRKSQDFDPIAPGKMAWLNNPIKHTSKFSQNWLGPYKIISRRGQVYTIEDRNQMTSIVNRSRLKEFKNPSVDVSYKPCEPTVNPPKFLEDNDEHNQEILISLEENIMDDVTSNSNSRPEVNQEMAPPSHTRPTRTKKPPSWLSEFRYNLMGGGV